MTKTPTVRKGQAPAVLSRKVFHERFMQSFVDPAFRLEDDALARLEIVAWDAYIEGRKSPVTRKAGPGYADPSYEMSVDWLATKKKVEAAQALWSKKNQPVAGVADLRLRP